MTETETNAGSSATCGSPGQSKAHSKNHSTHCGQDFKDPTRIAGATFRSSKWDLQSGICKVGFAKCDLRKRVVGRGLRWLHAPWSNPARALRLGRSRQSGPTRRGKPCPTVAGVTARRTVSQLRPGFLKATPSNVSCSHPNHHVHHHHLHDHLQQHHRVTTTTTASHLH